MPRVTDAQENLRGSKAGGPFSLTITFNDEFSNRDLVEAVAESWRTVLGLDVELVPMDWDQYREALEGGGLDGAFRFGWQPEYVSPDAYLAPLFLSTSVGRTNFSRFNDDEFDQTMSFDARSSVTDEDLLINYQLSEDIACDQMPAFPVVLGARAFLVRTDTVGAARENYTDIGTGNLVLRELFIR